MKGNIIKYARDNIDTDVIIPGQYLKVHDYAELATHAMEGLDPDFHSKVKDGDFILSGGETASFVVLDSILRLLPGVLGNEHSKKEESFENGLLEYPQYTKPQIWEQKSVPDVLLSGDHAKIKDWRLSQSEAITRVRRPDLWQKYKKN